MKKIYLPLFLFFYLFSTAQNDNARIETIKNKLDAILISNVGLTETVKTDISVTNITLSNFLLAISEVHRINLNLSPELDRISIVNNFNNVTVADLLVFLCKEYNLTIDFTGNILSVKMYSPPPVVPKKHVIPVNYNPIENLISIDAKGDKLYDVFKRIMDETGKNLVFKPGMENKLITTYINNLPFDSALENMALSNNLLVEKNKEHFYVFEDLSNPESQNIRRSRKKGSNLNFTILNTYDKLLKVDFDKVSIADVINDIGEALDINIFTATPLEQAGTVTFRAKSIRFDELLTRMFESSQSGIKQNSLRRTSEPNSISASNRNSPNTSAGAGKQFTFKKENDIYYFGTEDQLSVRKSAIIQLQHRSVELLSDPSGGSSSTRTVGRTSGNQNRFDNISSRNNNGDINSRSQNTGSFNVPNQNTFNSPNFGSRNSSFGNSLNSSTESLLSILPDDVIQDLNIKTDVELNSIYVTGSGTNIERLKTFIEKIDKPVPVILIEVMIIEINRNASIETGINWGIGDSPTETKGNLFPTADVSLGANTINKILNGFDGFGYINIGKVVPNFSASIRALETNGNIRVRSTPKLSTLNGHRATFSNGQTSYYAVTQRNIYGIENPQTSEIRNYEPIDAELGLTIKPMVSGDGQVTMDIFVVQSSFGLRIDEDAPPDLSSREFTSIIRVKDQDVVVLGGLEEQEKNDSGSGVPFLARVPIIKWFFSQRKRVDSKAKLTVLIKPTVIY